MHGWGGGNHCDSLGFYFFPTCGTSFVWSLSSEPVVENQTPDSHFTSLLGQRKELSLTKAQECLGFPGLHSEPKFCDFPGT